MPPKKRRTKPWSVEEKAKVLTETARLNGAELSSYLERQGLLLGELEQWRLALEEEGRASLATTKRIRRLERELARKEKALAEAAALLVLKKTSRTCGRTRTTTRARATRADRRCRRGSAREWCAAACCLRRGWDLGPDRRAVEEGPRSGSALRPQACARELADLRRSRRSTGRDEVTGKCVGLAQAARAAARRRRRLPRVGVDDVSAETTI